MAQNCFWAFWICVVFGMLLFFYGAKILPNTRHPVAIRVHEIAAAVAMLFCMLVFVAAVGFLLWQGAVAFIAVSPIEKLICIGIVFIIINQYVRMGMK